MNPPKTWGSFAEQPKNETIKKLVGLLSVYCLMIETKPPGQITFLFFWLREADEICVAGLIFSSYCLTYNELPFLLVIWYDELSISTTQLCSFEGDLHTRRCEGLLIYFLHTILNGLSSQSTRIKHQYSWRRSAHGGHVDKFQGITHSRHSMTE